MSIIHSLDYVITHPTYLITVLLIFLLTKYKFFLNVNEEVQQMIKLIEKTTSKMSPQSKIFSPLLSSVKKREKKPNYSSIINISNILKLNINEYYMRNDFRWKRMFINVVSSPSIDKYKTDGNGRMCNSCMYVKRSF